MDIDLGREVASRLGVQAEFKEFDSNTKNGLVNLVSIYKTRLL